MEAYISSKDITIYITQNEVERIKPNNDITQKPFEAKSIESLMIEPESEQTWGKIILYGPDHNRIDQIKMDIIDNKKTLHFQIGNEAYKNLSNPKKRFYNENFDFSEELHTTFSSYDIEANIPISIIVNEPE